MTTFDHERVDVHRTARPAWIVAALCIVAALLGCPARAEDAAPPARPDRASALRGLCSRIGVGEGAVIADIGCGSGQDSFVFASVVGPKGVVFAEEIEPGKLKDVLAGAVQHGLSQVVPVLGQTEDPRLPDGRVHLIYMNLVFHHFSAPRSMLRRFWTDLAPGGYLAISDKARGPIQDRVPLEKREKAHHWTGETAVVRLAREEGFLFVDAPDERPSGGDSPAFRWFEPDSFILVFQKPRDGEEPRGDPDGSLPLDAAGIARLLPVLRPARGAAAVFACDAGRAFVPALRDSPQPPVMLFDVIPEEWTFEADELPAWAGNEPLLAEGSRRGASTILRTEKGDLSLPEGTVLGTVIFADAYHRLWSPAPILSRLRAAVAPEGKVAVIDRRGPDGEPRRLAGHRRRVSPALVREEMQGAGFTFLEEIPAPAGDRFLLIFGPAPSHPPSGVGEKERLF